MRYFSPVLVLMAVLLLQVPATQAAPITFVATLSGAAESHPTVLPEQATRRSWIRPLTRCTSKYHSVG